MDVSLATAPPAPSKRLAWANPLRWPEAPHPDDEVAFWEHRREEGVHAWRMLLLLGALVTVLWWPTDPWIFGHVPGAVRAFAIARGFAASCAVAMFLLVRTVPAFRARPFMAMSGVALSVGVVTAVEFGKLGGPGVVWIHLTHLLVLSPIAITLRPAQRVLLTIAIAVALLGTLFTAYPEHLHDPYAATTISWFVFLVALGVVGGLFADALRRNEFFQRRSAMRLAEELRVLKESLEDRVEERTSEVRRLASHLETARESERTRIARELHDELGQELTALRYAVELARKRWTNDPASIGRNLTDIEALLQRTRLTARSIVAELRPRVLDDLGFGAASEWLVQRARERTSAEVTLTMPGGEPRLTPDGATAAFRVLQEALSNATRHARPNRIEVEVTEADGEVRLVVRDDGGGFDPQKARSTDGGFGIIGMRERAAALGGRLELDSAPGTTTTLTLRLPAAGGST